MVASQASLDELDALSRLRQRLLGRDSPPLEIGRYRAIRRIGQGGMGEVWLAEDPRLGRAVALKLLHARAGSHASQGRARLLREAQAIAQIAHPNVVAIFDCGTVVVGPDEPPRSFIAMEYVDGRPLDRWLEEQPRTREAILDVFLRAGRGLAAAHAAGQIHRDFKPSNVMVTSAGEAKVLDFGLVLFENDPSGSGHGTTEITAPLDRGRDPSGVDSMRLTEPGLVMGTPRYMAPEQHTGASVTAAADQFAFCCALLEALQHELPFVGQGHSELGQAKLHGAIHRNAAAGLPAWLVRTLERGLAPQPERRWPSMEVLLDRLQRRGRRTRWMFAAAATGLLAAAAAAVPTPDACAARLEWDESIAADLGTRQLGGDRNLGDELVAAADRIAGAEAATCEAHRAGTLAADAFDRRMACLRERRAGFTASVGVLARPDEVPDARAHDVVWGLASVDPCLDDAALASAVAPPSDPEVAAAVEHARAEMARAHAWMLAGRQQDALALYTDLEDMVAHLGYAPLTATLGIEIGRLRAETGDRSAVAVLEQALVDAEASGDDRVAAEAASALIYAMTHDPKLYDRALDLVSRGDALVRRAGDDPETRGHYWMAVGALRVQRREWDEALPALERSVASLESVLPEDALDVGAARANLGVALRQLGRHDEAIAVHQRVLDQRERALGPSHTRTIRALLNLATDYEAAGRAEDAAATYSEAIRRGEAALGPNHVDVLFGTSGLARALRSLRRFDESRAMYLRALEITEARGELDSLDATMLLSNLGNLERQTDRLDDAREHLERAIAVRERLVGAEHYLVGQSSHLLAGVELHAANPARARFHATRAVALLDAASHVAAEERARAHARLGQCGIELGDLDLAAEQLDAARAIDDTADGVAMLAGRVALARGELDAARRLFADALAVADSPEGRATAHVHAADAATRAGDPTAAADAITQARAELVAAGPAGAYAWRLLRAVEGG